MAHLQGKRDIEYYICIILVCYQHVTLERVTLALDTPYYKSLVLQTNNKSNLQQTSSYFLRNKTGYIFAMT